MWHTDSCCKIKVEAIYSRVLHKNESKTFTSNETESPGYRLISQEMLCSETTT
jgi:hypothetical protein